MVEQGTGQRSESICSLTYLVNEGQLNKQVHSHREGYIGTETGARVEWEGKFISLSFVFPFSFLQKEEIEEEYQPGPPVTDFLSLTE